MSDVTPEAAPQTPAAPEPDQTVPYHRFKEANDNAKAARTQLQEMQARLEELESRDKSELERERSKRTQFEQQTAELSARLQRMERSGLIRAAAAAAGFEDPDDAIAFIGTDSIESDADAEKAVKALAKRKPKLLREQAPPPPQIGRVLENGQHAPNGQQPAELDPAAAEFLRQVQAASQTGWTSSTIE